MAANAAAIVKHRLREMNCPIPFLGSDIAVMVNPAGPEGFSVGLTRVHHKWYVHFDQWREGYENPADAADFFLLGLSDRCRLEILMSNGVPARWTVYMRRNGVWQRYGTARKAGGIFVSFRLWRKHSICKQNHWLKSTDD